MKILANSFKKFFKDDWLKPETTRNEVPHGGFDNQCPLRTPQIFIDDIWSQRESQVF